MILPIGQLTFLDRRPGVFPAYALTTLSFSRYLHCTINVFSNFYIRFGIGFILAASIIFPTAVSATDDDLSPSRPVMQVEQGRLFRWVAPEGWTARESMAGVDLSSADGKAVVSSVVLMRQKGQTSPEKFVTQMLRSVPGFAQVRVLKSSQLESQPSGFPGMPWRVAELQLEYTFQGTPVRGTWTCGICDVLGYFYDAFIVSYQSPVETWDRDKTWLPAIALSIECTNAQSLAGNDTLLAPKNHPLENSGLLESWRRKGLSDDIISQARREGMMGYSRLTDHDGNLYNMPLENYDGTVGGYRDPKRPSEILQKAPTGY
jgi:hypothetical protein